MLKNEIQTVILEVKSEQKKAKMRELQVLKTLDVEIQETDSWDMY